MDFAMFAPMRWMAVAALALLVAAPARAAVVTFELDTEFSGATPPQGTAPWLIATFEDVGADTVRLTLEGNLTANEEVKGQNGGWYFNLTPDSSVGSLAIAFDSSLSTGNFDGSWLFGADSFKADGDGFFDFRVVFGDSSGSFDFAFGSGGTFNGTEVAVFTLSMAGLDAADFNTGSENSAKSYVSAAHVQSIDIPRNGEVDKDGSGWITDVNERDNSDLPGLPEPTSLAAWLLGSAGLGIILRGRMKKAAA